MDDGLSLLQTSTQYLTMSTLFFCFGPLCVCVSVCVCVWACHFLLFLMERADWLMGLREIRGPSGRGGEDGEYTLFYYMGW